MGVHGLTTYLRENKHILSCTLQFTKSYPKNSAKHVPLVVDAWSFIYELAKYADLPWVYGGEYTRFAQLIEQVVEAWIDVGLEVHFVFDGPYTALKLPTLVSRITQNHIQTSLLFFRTSAAARTSPRFLRETAMLPPLAYSVCVDTLRRLASQSIIHKRDEGNQSEGCKAGGISLYLHFADEEGDPYAVALAGRLEAYIAGRDSDFVVLNAVGYRGYVPLDDMLWTLTTTSSAPWDADGSVCDSASVTGEVDTNSSWEEGEVGENGFQIVRKGKRKERAAKSDQNLKVGRGILPPSGPDPVADVNSSAEKSAGGQLTLSFAVYDPSILAAHLGIPVSLLPLVGALLGNDFTGAGVDEWEPPPATMAEIKTKGKGNLQRLFFERGMTHTQRITRVAGTLKRILAQAFGASAGGTTRATGRKRGKTQIGSVMELIDAAVTALLVKPLDTFATGEREAVVERIAEATLQYAIPRSENADLGQNEEGLRWVSDVCPLHMPETCPLFASLSGLVDPRPLLVEGEAGDKAKPCEHEAQMLQENVRERYVQAYRLGQLDPHILDTVRTGTMWPRTFLEDPDKESVQRSVGRPVRMWTYAVLDAGIGLPSGPEPELEEEEGEGEDEDEDEDELIDVVEEDEIDDDNVRPQDPLARLRGVLKELDGSDDRDDTGDILPQHPTSSIFGTPGNERQKIIMEYVRRGTRLVPEEISVPRLSGMFQDVSLEHHDAQSPPQLWADNTRKTVLLRALASDSQRIACVPDESLISVLAVRWVVRSMHLRAQENPGVKERIAEQWTQTEARAVLASFSEPKPSPEVEETNKSYQIVERHIQLVAQILIALDAIEQLSQVLLLSPAVESPARRFSGRRCHALLSGRIALIASEPSEEIWHACLDGLEDAFAPPRQKKDRKSKGRAAAAALVRRTEKGKVQGVGRGGLFGLLGDMEA